MATALLNTLSTGGKPFYADDFSVLEFASQYDCFFELGLTDEEKRDLIQDLLDPPPPGSNVVTSRKETEEIVDRGGWSTSGLRCCQSSTDVHVSVLRDRFTDSKGRLE